MRHSSSTVKRCSIPEGEGMKFLIGAGRLCLDLTRTVRRRGSEASEGLDSAGALVRWCRVAGVGVRLVSSDVTVAQVNVARELREAIYNAVEARVLGKTPRKCDITLLNHCAGAPEPVPHLNRAGDAIAWKAESALNAVLSLVARDAIDLLGSSSIRRVRECADENCTSLFLDTSRPGLRRWCSAMPCANRHKIRAHRARTKTKTSAAKRLV